MLASVTVAVASNWGAGQTNQAWRCLNVGQANFRNSECVSDTFDWRVYVDSGIPGTLKTAIQSSVTNDYNAISGFIGTNQTALDGETDARVTLDDIPGTYPHAIFTTCASGAIEGGGTGYYRWCKRALVVYDDSHPDSTHVKNNANWYACHELGHTTGLAHYVQEVTHNTCMDYDDTITNLSSHDVEHLQDCYPIPNPAPYDLTPGCYIEGVH